MALGRKSTSRAVNKDAILRNHPIFGGLGSEFLDRLSSYAIRQTVKRGTQIFAKGDPGTSLFAVCSGTVKISAASLGGRDAAFNLMTEGALFGEIALLDGRPRTADARAVTAAVAPSTELMSNWLPPLDCEEAVMTPWPRTLEPVLPS